MGISPTAAHALPQQAGIDPTQTTSSFDWWPYPDWGASPSAPVLMTSTSISTTLATTYITVASVSTESVHSSSSSTVSTSESAAITSESTTGISSSAATTVQITAILAITSPSPQDSSTASARPATFKPIYLLPVTIIAGAILGASVTAFLYSRWYSVRRPLLREGESIPATFPANRGGEWEDEEDKRDEEEKRFIVQPDDSDDEFRVGDRRSSNGGPGGHNHNRLSGPVTIPAVARHSPQSSNRYPESEILKPKSGFSRARTPQTRRTEYDDVDSWYAREARIEEDNDTGLSDEEPPSPYARLSDFRKPRVNASGYSEQELPDYGEDDPAQSLLPTSVDRSGVFRRRVTPIHMRGHGRTDSNTVTPDVLQVPNGPLAGKLLPPSPASVYPEDEATSLQKETPSLPHSTNKLPLWPPGYRYHQNPHARALSPPPSQLVPSDLPFSDPPRFSTAGSGDSLDLILVLEDENGPPVPPKRSGKVSKGFPASVSASSTLVNPPSQLARKYEPNPQQAFRKVDDILRRSWDQRDVGDRPSSPTGFGAIIDGQPGVQRMLYGARPMRSGNATRTGQVRFGTVREEEGGIEQRLADLRRKDNRFDRT